MYLPTLLSAGLATLAAASSLTITIPPSTHLPNPNSLPAGTHATLTSISHTGQDHSKGHYPLTAPLTRSSTFIFRNLDSVVPAKPESFLLDIRSARFVFAPFRVDVASNGAVLGVWETFRGNPWDNLGEEKFVPSADSHGLDVVVEAKVIGRKEFYEERTSFSPLTLLKNPMILLALVAMVFAFGMPKLMQNMDPEMREEFEKHSRSSPIGGATRNAMGGGGAPSFDLAGWMAGTAPGPMASVEGAGEATGRDTGSATRRR